jgi:hypothetical protein
MRLEGAHFLLFGFVRSRASGAPLRFGVRSVEKDEKFVDDLNTHKRKQRHNNN